MQTKRYLTCLLALLFTPGLALQAGDDTRKGELDNSSHVEAQQPEAVKPGQAARVANVVLGILGGILGVLIVTFSLFWWRAEVRKEIDIETMYLRRKRSMRSGSTTISPNRLCD